ncbi:MAG TPA: ATP-binding protein, partial [Bryobacteraceae bacterium]|nr:ATP-binding protein [Bryobacteraceae bacterium]
FRANEDVPLRFRSNVSSLIVPAGVASGIYRIAQEALRNVSKHAHGSAVAITISAARNSLRVSIRDYGPGFDAADARFNSGLGLISMQERARAMDGSLAIRSTVGRGTLVVLQAPLHEAKHEAEVLEGAGHL